MLCRTTMLLILGAGLPLAHFGLTPSSADSKPAGAPAPPTPLFAQTVPAKNPMRISLQADEQKVAGWISGTESYTGKRVTVTVNGKSENLTVAQDNTFTWPYKIDKPVTATIVDRCVLLAELAGDYVVPPANVEMMYQTETRGHSGTFMLKVVVPKK
jgi:hypothetical protein